jgi:hypothetical protein
MTIRARLRISLNLYDNGNYTLFENIAITLFGGTYFTGFTLANIPNIFSLPLIDERHMYMQNYLGMSIGTKKQEKEGNSFELFSSPTYSITDYSIICNNVIGRLLKHELSIPIGFRKVYFDNAKIFSIKSGIGFHFAFPNNYTDYTTLEKRETVIQGRDAVIKLFHYEISYFSVFAEVGFHFGERKYKQVREQIKQLNFEKEVLL